MSERDRICASCPAMVFALFAHEHNLSMEHVVQKMIADERSLKEMSEATTPTGREMSV